MPSEPENLHPMLTRSSYAVQITSLILLPAAEFDPVTLELSPLLITEIPKGELVSEGKHTGGSMYTLNFRPEAKWDNGMPVTAEDYLFTIKAAHNPYVTASVWNRFLSFLSEVIIDPANPKSATVYIDSNYVLALEVLMNWNIYPAHIYDPGKIMSQFSLDELRDPEKQWTPAQDSLLRAFAASFESTKFFRDTVSGSGPYRFLSWTTGENIKLEKKDNWWGSKLINPPLLLQAYPDVIEYRIITDAATAEAALKSGQIDVMSEVPAASFIAMREDPDWKDKFQYITPEITQIYYLELNNRDPVLSDKRIRKALAHSLDYAGFMENLLVGLGKRAVGPIHPKRSYFNKNLKPVDYDLNKALALIKEAGWEDTNGNNIPDKVINGKREELRLSIKITNKQEGNTLATIIRENAKKAGFDIVIELVDPGQFTQDVRQFNFDIVPLRSRPLASVDEPFQAWHSDSDIPGGGNRSGFRNAEADETIEAIQTATLEERDELYYDLQEIIYEEQPSIFLYIPLERVIVSKKYDIISSSRKPGYFENLFRLAG